MVRISKQEERRSRSPKRCSPPSVKTGAKKESVSYKAHANAVSGNLSQSAFIPKIK